MKYWKILSRAAVCALIRNSRFQLGQTCDDPDVRAFLMKLGVPENHRVYGCAALGYAPEGAPMKDKKLAEGTVTVIR